MIGNNSNQFSFFASVSQDHEKCREEKEGTLEKWKKLLPKLGGPKKHQQDEIYLPTTGENREDAKKLSTRISAKKDREIIDVGCE